MLTCAENSPASKVFCRRTRRRFGPCLRCARFACPSTRKRQVTCSAPRAQCSRAYTSWRVSPQREPVSTGATGWQVRRTHLARLTPACSGPRLSFLDRCTWACELGRHLICHAAPPPRQARARCRHAKLPAVRTGGHSRRCRARIRRRASAPRAPCSCSCRRALERSRRARARPERFCP